MIKIWLDDIRPMPEGYTYWCKTCHEALSLISTLIDFQVVPNSQIGRISFDHDLGEPEPYNGNFVARFIEDMARQRKLPRLTWGVHSDNGPGIQNIMATMRSADRYWDEWELDAVGDHLSKQWKIFMIKQ